MPRARTTRRRNRRRTSVARNRPATKRKKRTTRRPRRNAAKRKPRANKRRRRASAAPRKRRRRNKRTAAKRTNKRRRRRRNPVAKRTNKRRRSARRKPAKRRRRRNPVAKRTNKRRRRRNTGAKRRTNKHRRRRRNAGGAGVVGSVRKQLKELMKPQVWLIPSLHGAIGFGIASYGPSVLSRYTGQFGLRNHGLGGVALSGISTAIGAGLLGWAASMLPKKGLAGKCCSGIVKNVAIGGFIATTIRLIHELAPTSMMASYLPRVGMMSDLSGMYGLGMTQAQFGAGGYGHYPGQYPSYGPLGMVESPEQLVASESFARQINQLDGMGQPVPVEDIADWMQLSGMGGMRDWVEFTPGSPYAMDAAQGDPGFPGSQGF